MSNIKLLSCATVRSSEIEPGITVDGFDSVIADPGLSVFYTASITLIPLWKCLSKTTSDMLGSALTFVNALPDSELKSAKAFVLAFSPNDWDIAGAAAGTVGVLDVNSTYDALLLYCPADCGTVLTAKTGQNLEVVVADTVEIVKKSRGATMFEALRGTAKPVKLPALPAKSTSGSADC